MDSIIKALEKAQPYFEKISKNIYLQAIKDGFLASMPIILSSSIFLLVATLPGVFGITLPTAMLDFCNKFYNYTMGVVGIMVAGTTANALTGSINRRMPAGKAVNPTSTMIAAMCGMMILSVTELTAVVDGSDVSVFDINYMGTKGLLSSFVAAFVTVHMYEFCIKRDITIKMPKEVPGAIAQSFRDIFAFSFSILACLILDTAVRAWIGVPFSEMIATLFEPIFSAADSYAGLALIGILTPLLWFMGIHGPSVVQPPIQAALYANTATNLANFTAGGTASLTLTMNFLNYVEDLGGTGATFVVPFIFLFFMKSKQLKAVGKASIVPCFFAVNEPLLFAAPIILNPYFLVPFVLAPVANNLIGKFFISVLGMNGFMYALPWALPGPIGIVLDTNFQFISFVFVAVILAVDFLIYFPFCKAYDNVLCKQEAEALAAEGADGEVAVEAAEVAGAVKAADEPVAQAAAAPVATAAPAPVAAAPAEKAPAAAAKVPEGELRVLVLCAGAGTSALLANALTEGAQIREVDLVANAGAYGSHYNIMAQYDVIVLAPQVRTYYEDLKADTDRLGIKLIPTRGKEYIDLTHDPEGAVDWIYKALSEA